MEWRDIIDEKLAVTVDDASHETHGYVARTRGGPGEKKWRVCPSMVASKEILVLHAAKGEGLAPQWVAVGTSGVLSRGTVRLGDLIIVRKHGSCVLGTVTVADLSSATDVDVLVAPTGDGGGAGGMEEVFALENPRNVFSGLWGGIKNIAVGVGAGVAVMVAAPVAGAREDGMRGAMKGAAVGVATGTVLAVCGCVTGAAQIVRGIKNTPSACNQLVRNTKVWDARTGEWTEYDLQREAEGLGGGPTEGSIVEAARKRRKGPVVGATSTDKTLYDVLGVRPEATPSEVKHAYMKLALQHHPDRNHGSGDLDAAKVLFQSINSAYHVLNDKEQRSRYDRGGMAAVEGGEGTPSYLSDLVGSIVGAELFKDFIGTLVGLHFLDGVSFSTQELRELRRTREVRLAIKLTFFTTNGVPEELVERLLTAPLGREMIFLVGQAYVTCVERYMAKDRVNLLDQFCNDAAHLKEYMVSSAHAVSSTASVIYDVARNKIPQDATMSTGAKFIDLMWHLVSQDVLDAIEKATEMALYDVGLSSEDRVRRCDALQQVGRHLMSCGRPYEWGVDRTELLGAV